MMTIGLLMKFAPWIENAPSVPNRSPMNRVVFCSNVT